MVSQDLILIKETYINEIPVVFVESKDCKAGKKPIIFVFHRLLQDKEYELRIYYKLAKENFFVVGIDMYGHGERNINDNQKYDFNNLIKDSYMTANDTLDILNFLR